MALNLYRRQRQECEAEHPEESRSGELEERKKTWKRCKCQIYGAGTLRGHFRRRRTGKWEWDDAKTVAAAWEASGSWDTTAGPSPATSDLQTGAITITAATEAYLESRRNRGIQSPTVAKYKTLAKQLRE